MNKNLVSLLEMLDGNNTNDNSVMIFTTNHEDNFDEALFRPGRITGKLNISLMTPSMWTKLVNNVYGVEHFKFDHCITLSKVVQDFIVPNIDDYDAFLATVHARLSI
jgi:ATP-dependent 26S proteasome regulatory subunit